jgi:hypothetical protein
VSRLKAFDHVSTRPIKFLATAFACDLVFTSYEIPSLNVPTTFGA